MQQQRLIIIQKLLSLHSVALQVPRYPKLLTNPVQQQQMRSSIFPRYLTQATTTTNQQQDGQKTNRSQQKITLIAQNQAMTITTLDEAQKLAKRRDLHLLRLNETDAKTGRVAFRLVTAAEMLADDQDAKGAAKTVADKSNKKAEKSLSIGARITDHDLASRLKNITKWLNKRHEVRILIQGHASGSDEGNAERIVKTIETTIKEPEVIGKIVQKRHKGGFIKFSIMPVAMGTATPTTAKTTTSTKVPQTGSQS